MTETRRLPLTVAVLAGRLGITPQSLYTYLNRGDLLTHQLGNVQVILPEVADAFERDWRSGKLDRSTRAAR
jgi:hypothetical protein